MEMKIYRSSGARWRWQGRCLRVNFIAKTPTWTRKCSLHSFSIPLPYFFSNGLTSTDNLVLSICTWLSVLLPNPPTEIRARKLSYHGEIPAWSGGRDYIFPLRLYGRSIRLAASISCLASGAQTTKIHMNPCQVFEFKFRKDYGRNSLCHVVYWNTWT